MANQTVSSKLEPWHDLTGKVVMVTGVSSGLGRDFCIDLAKAGCRIIAAARRIDRLVSLCDEINQLGRNGGAGTSANCEVADYVRAVAVELDVSGKGAAIEASVKKAWAAFGRIDGLINNAGVRGIINDRVQEEGELRSAFAKTENEFIACAREKVASSPSIDGAGASCLVAFVRDQKVIISHVGNCRAVVGVKKWGFLKYTIISETLTTEHFEKWGILDEPICDPILCSVPSFSVRDIEPRDSFIVVASDGLWNILSNDEVVQFIYDNRGKNGIAKLLVEKATRKAEEMREKRIKDMVGSVEVGRAYDDITVVLFLNKGKKKSKLEEVRFATFAPPAASDNMV